MDGIYIADTERAIRERAMLDCLRTLSARRHAGLLGGALVVDRISRAERAGDC